jgi:hypothetical protein
MRHIPSSKAKHSISGKWTFHWQRIFQWQYMYKVSIQRAKQLNRFSRKLSLWLFHYTISKLNSHEYWYQTLNQRQKTRGRIWRYKLKHHLHLRQELLLLLELRIILKTLMATNQPPVRAEIANSVRIPFYSVSLENPNQYSIQVLFSLSPLLQILQVTNASWIRMWHLIRNNKNLEVYQQCNITRQCDIANIKLQKPQFTLAIHGNNCTYSRK